MSKRKKILLVIVPVVILALYRFVLTLPMTGEGRYMDSPDNSMKATVTGYSTEYFFGGKHNFSVFEVYDKNRKQILKHKYSHPEKDFEWYRNGKIVWEDSGKVTFISGPRAILHLYLKN